jgi:hypothetical protein
MNPSAAPRTSNYEPDTVVVTLVVMCGIALSAVGKSGTPQNSATKKAAPPDDIPKSVAESLSGTLQFGKRVPNQQRHLQRIRRKGIHPQDVRHGTLCPLARAASVGCGVLTN